ncbi:MAG: class I SAM-dependent methyltransferase, partial [Thermoplasmata archaeon]
RDAWSGSAEQYDAYEQRWHFYGAVGDAMVRELPLEENSRVLELACGTGACTRTLARIVRTGTVVALDYSEGMLEVARRNSLAARPSCVVFVHGDAVDIERLLKGMRFDFAVCNSAFWHFPEPERVLRALHDLLTEAGQFALSLPTWVEGNSERRESFRAMAREVLKKYGVTPEQVDAASAEWPRPTVDLPRLLVRSGFTVREVPFEMPVSPGSRAAWRQISVFSERGARSRLFPGLDPAVRRQVREELDAWRRAQPPRDDRSSRWRILVAQRS